MVTKGERGVAAAAAAAKSLQSCPTLRNPMDCCPPGSSIHGIFPGKSTGGECHCLLPITHWTPQSPSPLREKLYPRAYEGSETTAETS